MASAARKRPPRASPADADAGARIDAFIDKFEPGVAALIRRCRRRLRKVFPSAIEVVYDNYNFFVIGYSPSGRPSDTVVSLIAAANGVALSFYRGATLADPHGLLHGSGVQNRFVRLPTGKIFDDERVRELIAGATAQSRVPFRPAAAGGAVIKSVSANQRRRRRPGALEVRRP